MPPCVAGGKQCYVAGLRSDAGSAAGDRRCVKAEIQATKQELAAAEQAENGAKVDFLRKEVTSLCKQEDRLREQQTIFRN